jgi:excisionase family DNA binding protein
MNAAKPDVTDDVLVLHKKEAARLTKLSMASIDRAIARGELKTKKYGKRTLIMRSELARFLDALPDQPRSKAKPR